MKRNHTMILAGLGLFLCAAQPMAATAPEALLPAVPAAGANTQAQDILSRTSQAYRQAGSVKMTFGGSQQGELWLKGDRFYLNCGGVESWFDGKTQWSYVASNEEVTVSTPTPEELQSINPFALLNQIQTQFHSLYVGEVKENGKSGKKLQLTPLHKGDVTAMTLVVSSTYKPVSIRIKLENGEEQYFSVKTYRTHQNLQDAQFRFPSSKYPHAEVIDMR